MGRTGRPKARRHSRQAIEKGTIEGYNYFLSHYASSEHVVEITRLADKTTFAQLDNTIEAYKKFIELYPQSPLIEEAQSRIYRLAYAQARKTHTREAYQQLLAEYPDHPMKEEAQSAIESFDYLSISRPNMRTINFYGTIPILPTSHRSTTGWDI